VFYENPYPYAVNGSLWTLAVEVYCYAVLAIVGAIGALRRPWLALALALALFALGEWSSWFIASMPRSESAATPRLAGTFVAGTLAFVWRRHVPISPWFALAAVAAIPVMASTPFAVYGIFGAIAYATLTVSYHPSLDVPAYRRFGDYSYGVYVYAFPTQQAIAWLTGEVAPMLLLALAYPVIVALAIASWNWIEEPALRFKRRPAADAAISARPP
jgi:peptidoglycan/LPS O-acetylase OafA/YrhL